MFGSMSEVQLRLYIYIYIYMLIIRLVTFSWITWLNIIHTMAVNYSLFIDYPQFFFFPLLIFSFLSTLLHVITFSFDYIHNDRETERNISRKFLSCFVFLWHFFPFIDRTVARQEVKWERGGTGSGKVREPGLEHRMPEAQLRYMSTRCPRGIGTDSVSLKQVW